MKKRRFSVVAGVARADVVLALASAILGVVITGLVTGGDSTVMSTTWLVFLGFVALVLAVGLVTVKVDDLKRAVEVMSLQGVGGSGVRLVSSSEMSELAAGLMRECHVVRIVGTARQDAVIGDEGAARYLRETERRLARSKTRLLYRRITTDSPRARLHEHLLRILQDDNRHDVQIALAPNLSIALSYQVFDDRYALVTVDAPMAPGLRDNGFALITSSPSAVAALAAHFDHAWASLAPVSTQDGFREAVAAAQGGGTVSVPPVRDPSNAGEGACADRDG